MKKNMANKYRKNNESEVVSLSAITINAVACSGIIINYLFVPVPILQDIDSISIVIYKK